MQRALELYLEAFIKHEGPTCFNIPYLQKTLDGRFSAAYVIKHVESGKIYPGSTRNYNARKNTHESFLRLSKHPNKNLQEAFNKNNKFTWACVITNTVEQAIEIEQFLLDKYRNSGLLFNVAIDAKSSFKGLKHSDERNLLMSNILTGRHVSKETRKRLSIANKGKKPKDEVLVKAIRSSERPVYINGFAYKSVRDAAKELQLNYAVVVWRLGSKLPNWFNWEYVDKKFL